jgi:hypothetical protein
MPKYRSALIALFLVATVPAAAQAQDATTARLVPGEQIMMVIDDGGVPRVTERGPAAPLSPFEAAAIRELLTNHNYAVGPDVAILTENQGLPTPEPVAKGQIRLRFIRLPADHSLLLIENGFERGLRYRAKMARGDKEAATDVCTVIPLKRGYEYWPYRIDRIDLSSFALFPMGPDDRPTCE